MSLYLLAVHKQLLKRFTITRLDFRAVRDSVLWCVQYAQQTGRTIFNRHLPFSQKQFRAWSNSRYCAASPLRLCRKKHPQQLTEAEQKNILKYATDKRFENYPLSSVYCQLLRDKQLHCHISTFYKYCRLLRLTRKQKRFKKTYTPLTAAHPLQMLHLDVTIFRTADQLKQYLYVIRDNCSRAILACTAAAEYSATIACQTLTAVLKKFDLMEKEGQLVTDDGSENKDTILQLLARPGMLWKKMIAQIDIIQSNSMVEAANKIIKHRFLYQQRIANLQELTAKLPAIIAEYNNTPLVCLSAYTPNEVLNGAIPDPKRFAPQLRTAKKNRIATNQHFNCLDTC